MRFTPALLAFLFIALQPLSGEAAPPDLVAKSRYQEAVRQKQPGAQQAYVNALADILDADISRFVTTGNRDDAQLERIYAELKKFPAPANSDSRALTKLRIGKWQSPRHDYLYRANGTWSMLPLERDATAGHWRIEGNRYYDGVDETFSAADRFTIILLDKNYFIFMSGDGTVYFEYRL